MPVTQSYTQNFEHGGRTFQFVGGAWYLEGKRIHPQKVPLGLRSQVASAVGQPQAQTHRRVA